MAGSDKRSKKKKDEGSGTPAWLVTFSDIMTLLLTFFVLLLSMATLQDERKEYLALGSIQETFGMGKQTMSVLGKESTQRMMEPGPMTDQKTKDLAPLKKKLWEDENKDLEFLSNKFVQILSIHSDVLFSPGETDLNPEGKELLTKIAPFLNELSYPVLLSGHSSILEDEDRQNLFSTIPEQDLHASWNISLNRILSVYKYLLNQGVDSNKLKQEAFGKYNPRYSNNNKEGRKKNRRVDIILDKRNYIDHIPNKLKEYAGQESTKDTYKFRDFDFEFDNVDQNNNQ